MVVFYVYGWGNPDEIDSCISRDYRLNTDNEKIPTAKFNVAKAWAYCFKIDFYLACIMGILVLI